jgi:tRNA pseudouridine38-40 synthase
VNIALLLSYDGTAYHGWQRQNNAPSVQQTLTAAIEKLTGCQVTLHGCGRTDAGVHALRYEANYRSDSALPPERLPRAINAHLPPDISVYKAAPVPDSFHAINSAVRKEYTYLLYSSPERKPCYRNRALHYRRAVDEEKLRAALAVITGKHDFACFRSAGSHVRSTTREIYEAELRQRGDLLAIRIAANGFLYNMARSIVGTLLYLNEGKITDIPALIASGDRTAAGPTAPAHGLYMTDVVYGGGGLF